MTQKNKKGYDHDSVEDFLEDEHFVNWVLHPDAEMDHFWNNWISRHPDKREQLELAREMVQSITYKQKARMSPDDYAGILERLLSEQQSVNAKRIISIRPLLKIAAAIALIAVCGILMLNWSGVFTGGNAEWLVVSTKYGQKRTLYLPDGTKVRLNAGSTITYPEKFTNKQRSIKFSGEGFFEVTRNEKKPFIITSGKLTTRVLGTSFNIRSIEEHDDHSVAVATGKVKVTTQRGQYVLLLPDEMAVFQAKSGELSKRSFDREKLLAWKADILWFDKESLPKVFDKLEKWYGVTIVVTEGVDLRGHYTGKYHDKSLEHILKGITFTSNFKYKINHKTVTIYE